MEAKQLLKEYTGVIVIAAIFLGLVFPITGLFLSPFLIYLLMALMFFSCLEISIKDIIQDIKDYKKIILALSIISLFSALIVLLLKPFLSGELFLGLILIAVTPSGLSIVFLSKLFKGQPSKAMVIATLSNLLSPITIPLLVFAFASTTIKVNPFSMSLLIMQLVFIPFILTRVIIKTRYMPYIRENSTYFSIGLLFFLILGIISPLSQIIFSNLHLALNLSLLVVILIGLNFVIGRFIGQNKEEKMTYSLALSYKNFTLSTVLALSLFNPIVALPSVLYTIIDDLMLVPIQFLTRRDNKF